MIVIREMNIDDYDQVISLWQQTESMSLRDADSRASIATYLEANAGLSFVALLDNHDIVGAALVGTDGRRGYLQHLAVAKRYRGGGIGKKLMAQSLMALSNRGIDKTHLFVAIENTNAQSFYKNLGWVERDEVSMFSFNNSSNPDI